jgi:hypothetical protein
MAAPAINLKGDNFKLQQCRLCNKLYDKYGSHDCTPVVDTVRCDMCNKVFDKLGYVIHDCFTKAKAVVKVNGDGVYLRKEPRDNSPHAEKERIFGGGTLFVKNDQKVTVLKKEGDYSLIEVDSFNNGWIKSKYLAPLNMLSFGARKSSKKSASKKVSKKSASKKVSKKATSKKVSKKATSKKVSKKSASKRSRKSGRKSSKRSRKSRSRK